MLGYTLGLTQSCTPTQVRRHCGRRVPDLRVSRAHDQADAAVLERDDCTAAPGREEAADRGARQLAPRDRQARRRAHPGAGATLVLLSSYTLVLL